MPTFAAPARGTAIANSSRTVADGYGRLQAASSEHVPTPDPQSKTRTLRYAVGKNTKSRIPFKTSGCCFEDRRCPNSVLPTSFAGTALEATVLQNPWRFRPPRPVVGCNGSPRLFHPSSPNSQAMAGQAHEKPRLKSEPRLSFFGRSSPLSSYFMQFFPVLSQSITQLLRMKKRGSAQSLTHPARLHLHPFPADSCLSRPPAARSILLRRTCQKAGPEPRAALPWCSSHHQTCLATWRKHKKYQEIIQQQAWTVQASHFRSQRIPRSLCCSHRLSFQIFTQSLWKLQPL